MQENGKEKTSKNRKLTRKDLVTAIPALALCGAMLVSLGTYKAPVYAVEEYDSSDMKISRKEVDEEEITIGKGDFDLEDGTYEGTGVGYAGNVVVKVTIEDKTITAIDIVSNSDTASYFSRAKAVVVNEILEQQSYDVDSVSGATYSSRGIKNAVKNALTGEVDTSSVSASSTKTTTTITTVEEASAYKDGTYTGSGTGYGGTVTVKVTIKGGKIADVTVLSHNDTQSYFSKAKAVTSRIVSEQTTNVDGVSGATFSSKGIIEATRNALSKAAVDENSAETVEKTATVVAPSVKGLFPYPDGTYTGVGEGRNGDITVSVTIKDETITKITIGANEEDAPYLNLASEVLDQIVVQQTTDVDGISGATLSSNGLREATVNAIAKARATAQKAEKEEKQAATEKNTASDKVDNDSEEVAEDKNTKQNDESDEVDEADESEPVKETEDKNEKSTVNSGSMQGNDDTKKAESEPAESQKLDADINEISDTETEQEG